MAAGRARPRPMDLGRLEAWVDQHQPLAKIAFGSNLFGFLKDKARWDISLYPPEIMSKYILLVEELSLFNNSFEMNPVLKPSSAYEMRPA